VAPTVQAEVELRRFQVLTGQCVPGPYESHRDLLRLKVATLLGLLEGRATVTVEDWPLAGMVLDNSDAVREDCLAHNRRADAVVETERNVKAATRAGAEQSARRRADDAVIRVARVATRAVVRNGPQSRRQLRDAVGRDRDLLDDALAHAEAEGWLVENDHGKYEEADG
jgi:hypothetical protein